jgi:hypothetical protein
MVKKIYKWFGREEDGRRWPARYELNMMELPTMCMGEESGVSKATRLVKESHGGKLNGLKQRLLKGLNDDGEKNRLGYD